MTSLAYGYIELFICLRFPMAATLTGINKGGPSLFDAASGPFKFQIGTLMWPCGTLKICLNTFFFFFLSKELFWFIECSDGLSKCE